MLQLLQYTELLLYLPSQFCRKIIYCNKYVQRAYDLCCNYFDTQNYYWCGARVGGAKIFKLLHF